jgi:hypothetical protein
MCQEVDLAKFSLSTQPRTDVEAVVRDAAERKIWRDEGESLRSRLSGPALTGSGLAGEGSRVEHAGEDFPTSELTLISATTLQKSARPVSVIIHMSDSCRQQCIFK